MAEAWAVDRQLVIEWFRHRREAAAADTGEETEETDAKEPETRAEDTKSKPVHLKSRSKTNPRAGGKKSSGSSASGGRWTRSRESGGRVDRAARWLLEAARDKGQTGEEVRASSSSTFSLYPLFPPLSHLHFLSQFFLSVLSSFSPPTFILLSFSPPPLHLLVKTLKLKHGFQDLAALETETGLSGDLIRKWFQDNTNEK